MLHVPLGLAERVVGVASVFTYHPYEFSEDELFLMATIGEQCALAVRNAQAYGELRREYQGLVDDFQKWFGESQTFPAPDRLAPRTGWRPTARPRPPLDGSGRRARHCRRQHWSLSIHSIHRGGAPPPAGLRSHPWNLIRVMPAEGTGHEGVSVTTRPSPDRRSPGRRQAMRPMILAPFVLPRRPRLSAAARRRCAGRVRDAATGKPVARRASSSSRPARRGRHRRTRRVRARGRRPGAVDAGRLAPRLPGRAPERWPRCPTQPLAVAARPGHLDRRPHRGDRARAREGTDPATLHQHPAGAGRRGATGGRTRRSCCRSVAPGVLRLQRQRQRHRLLVLLDPRLRPGAAPASPSTARRSTTPSPASCSSSTSPTSSPPPATSRCSAASSASPGIGGAVDITTAPPAVHAGVHAARPAFGSYDTQRFASRYDSGLIDGTWALTARYSKITTDGYRDQSWVDMWNYYLSLARFGERLARCASCCSAVPSRPTSPTTASRRASSTAASPATPTATAASTPSPTPASMDNFYPAALPAHPRPRDLAARPQL